MAMFVVDSVKKLDFETKAAILRLKSYKFDPQDLKVEEALESGTFSEKKFEEGHYFMDDAEKELHSYTIPTILVLSKIDLVNNKVKLRAL